MKHDPLERYRAVEGFVRNEELDLLHRLASRLPPDAVVVEIGSYRGKSTLALAQGLVDGHGGTVYAIDPHPSYFIYGNQDSPALRQNVRESGLSNIEIIEDYSDNVIKSFSKPINMLWVDGNHEYGAVRSDFDNYTALLVDGGIVALHDNHVRGPWKVVTERILKTGAYGHVGVCWSVVYAFRNRGHIGPLTRCWLALYRAVFASLAWCKSRLSRVGRK